MSREDFLRLSAGDDGLGHFGIDRVVWPEAQLADDIERIVSSPGAIDAEVFAEGAVRLLEYRLDPGSPLTAERVADLHLPPGSLLVAVRRGETFFIPRGDTRLAAGDKAIVMGTPEAMATLQRRMTQGLVSERQSVTIIGGGDVGLRLAEHLDAMPSISLRVIERDERRGEALAARLGRALVLQGDGTDLALLESEDIGRSDVLVSVIDNDEKNLLASLLGRQLGVRRIITRVSQPGNLRLFERVGVDVAISARGAAIAAVLHELEGGAASLLAVLEQGEGRIVELEAPARLIGCALKDLESSTRQHRRRHPPGPTGDRATRPRPPRARRPADRLFDALRRRRRADVLCGRQLMRLALVVHVIGVLVRLFGPMFLLPAAVSLVYQEWRDAAAFTLTAAGFEHRSAT